MQYFLIALAVLFIPVNAWADCAGPAGVEAQIIYNGDHKTVQFCDGTNWVALGKSGAVSSLADLIDTNVSPTDGQVLTWDNSTSKWISAASANNGKFIDGDNANDAVYTTGNVGVGTTAPTKKLTVDGADNSIILSVRRETGGSQIIDLGADASGHGVLTIKDNTGSPITSITASGNSYINGGNVGIGTTAPSSTLTIAGANGFGNTGILLDGTIPTFKFSGSNTTNENYQIRLSTGDLLFQTNNNAFGSASSKVTFTNAGNVGIGTTNPGAKLDVAGKASANGFIFKKVSGIPAPN